jgi:ABC-2 type transport system ATP-binding protein
MIEKMIQVENLSKKYGDIHAVDGITFDVAKGEILGFLGPNGAGKTTTMRMITGFIPASSGRALIAGFDIFREPMEAKRKIGYLPEIPPLYTDMTVSAYLKFVARIKGIPRKQQKEGLEQAIEKCGLTDVRDRVMDQLSKGFKQRVGIAQAIIHNPDVLILDEPTIGLDPKQIIEIRNLIKSLSGDRTIVLSTHILPEVSEVCTRAIIIKSGKILMDKKISEISEKTHNFSIIFGSKVEREDIASQLDKLRVKVKTTDMEKRLVFEPQGEKDIRGKVVAELAKEHKILEVKSEVQTLEQIFVETISKDKEQ